MVGRKNFKNIIDELFDFAKYIVEREKIYPYVSFVVKDGVIISRGFNDSRYKTDITRQGDVVAVRFAQEALETGDLSGYSLYSFMEPSILGFDVAMWSGIRDFVWLINSTSLPNQYNKLKYTPLDYQKAYPNQITISNGIRENKALDLVKYAHENGYYPENLY